MARCLDPGAQLITGQISQGTRYTGIHPAFADAFAFLCSAEPAELPVGRHDRGSFTAVVVETVGKSATGARLEFHHRDIDIHLTLVGHDIIGWRPRVACGPTDGEFDEVNDIGFVTDRPQLWVPVPVGGFAVFFPEDAHAPLAGEGQLRKVVLKIADGQN
ncbi:MAG: YhcH/YjgK/YiaL family protein [Nakamurella sp.]